MADEKIIEGKKVEAAEAQKVDRKKVGKGQKNVPAAEVEGQIRRWVTVRCPWCASLNRILEDTERYLWFECWNCGNLFRY